MKILPRIILSAAVFAGAATSSEANVGGLDVAVTKNGKAVYQGKTDTSGNFNTGALQPGAYNVEFRAPASMNLKGKKLAISVAAGQDAPRLSNADGAHLQAGVAMNVAVAKTSRLEGYVSRSGHRVVKAKAPQDVAEAKTPPGMEKVKANVKVIKGKRYVWVPGPIGSNMGGRWAEEGSEAAVLATSNKKGDDGEVLRKLQSADSGAATLNGRGHQGPGNNNSGL